jgi:hypothetical protein
MAMEAREELAIEGCVERMMNADDSGICPLVDKVVELVDRLNRIVGAKQAGITRIRSEEDGTGASIIDGSATEEEEHVGDGDLGESSGSEEDEQNGHRRIGFLDEKGSCCLK